MVYIEPESEEINLSVEKCFEIQILECIAMTDKILALEYISEKHCNIYQKYIFKITENVFENVATEMHFGGGQNTDTEAQKNVWEVHDAAIVA